MPSQYTTPIKISDVYPGHCATALNNFKGAKDLAKIAVTMAMLPSDGATGGFFNDDGTDPW